MSIESTIEEKNQLSHLPPGLLFYYVISGGGHPFGDSVQREAHISAAKIVGSKVLADAPDFSDLIHAMVAHSPSYRWQGV